MDERRKLWFRRSPGKDVVEEKDSYRKRGIFSTEKVHPCNVAKKSTALSRLQRTISFKNDKRCGLASSQERTTLDRHILQNKCGNADDSAYVSHNSVHTNCLNEPRNEKNCSPQLNITDSLRNFSSFSKRSLLSEPTNTIYGTQKIRPKLNVKSMSLRTIRDRRSSGTESFQRYERNHWSVFSEERWNLRNPNYGGDNNSIKGSNVDSKERLVKERREKMKAAVFAARESAKSSLVDSSDLFSYQGSNDSLHKLHSDLSWINMKSAIKRSNAVTNCAASIIVHKIFIDSIRENPNMDFSDNTPPSQSNFDLNNRHKITLSGDKEIRCALDKTPPRLHSKTFGGNRGSAHRRLRAGMLNDLQNQFKNRNNNSTSIAPESEPLSDRRSQTVYMKNCEQMPCVTNNAGCVSNGIAKVRDVPCMPSQVYTSLSSTSDSISISAQSSPQHEGYDASSVHSSLKDFIESSTLRPKSNESSNASDSDSMQSGSNINESNMRLMKWLQNTVASPDTESARRKGRLFCSNIDKGDSAICRNDVNNNNSSASRVVHERGKENSQSWKGGCYNYFDDDLNSLLDIHGDISFDEKGSLKDSNSRRRHHRLNAFFLMQNLLRGDGVGSDGNCSVNLYDIYSYGDDDDE